MTGTAVAPGVRVLLCDADDCLFPSEIPAFEASAGVVNRLLAHVGLARRMTPDELRARATGRNFRASMPDLIAAEGGEIDPGELDPWVDEERREVTAHLAAVLRPDPAVHGPLAALAAHVHLALVSSSALGRIDACLRAAGLDALLPPAVRFSAEDSLPEPRSKPDPAVYAFAVARLGVAPAEALAIEDSVSGVRSARGAGVPVVGNVMFVPADERAGRRAALEEAGALAVVGSWEELGALLAPALAQAARAGAPTPVRQRRSSA